MKKLDLNHLVSNGSVPVSEQQTEQSTVLLTGRGILLINDRIFLECSADVIALVHKVRPGEPLWLASCASGIARGGERGGQKA